jgi:hypothetical protein
MLSFIGFGSILASFLGQSESNHGPMLSRRTHVKMPEHLIQHEVIYNRYYSGLKTPTRWTYRLFCLYPWYAAADRFNQS